MSPGVAVTGDGSRIVTGSNDKTARVWDARTGAELLQLKGHDGFVLGVAVTPDGRRVVTGSGDKTARVWVWDADMRAGLPAGSVATRHSRGGVTIYKDGGSYRHRLGRRNCAGVGCPHGGSRLFQLKVAAAVSPSVSGNA